MDNKEITFFKVKYKNIGFSMEPSDYMLESSKSNIKLDKKLKYIYYNFHQKPKKIIHLKI